MISTLLLQNVIALTKLSLIGPNPQLWTVKN